MCLLFISASDSRKHSIMSGWCYFKQAVLRLKHQPNIEPEWFILQNDLKIKVMNIYMEQQYGKYLWHDDWIVNANSGSDLPAKQMPIWCTVFVLYSFLRSLYCIWHCDLYRCLWSCVLCRRSDVSVVLWSQVEKRLESCAVNPRLLWGDASPSSSMITALLANRPPTTRWVHRHTSDKTRG